MKTKYLIQTVRFCCIIGVLVVSLYVDTILQYIAIATCLIASVGLTSINKELSIIEKNNITNNKILSMSNTNVFRINVIADINMKYDKEYDISDISHIQLNAKSIMITMKDNTAYKLSYQILSVIDNKCISKDQLL